MYAKLQSLKPVCFSLTSKSLATNGIIFLNHIQTIFAVIWLLCYPLAVSAGSCREAQLCCSGRDSSCVVQKAPMNAIIEDLNDKPCYCDHACLKLGDCCVDFKDHCGVLDCEVGDWSQWSECDNICGKGLMTRTRQVLQAAQNGGKHCPTLAQKRTCRGYRCHGNRDKKILRETALLLPAATSHSRRMNNSSDVHHNSHGAHEKYHRHQEHEYCVEFEVFKTSKSCQNLPPYNLLQEGDRIIVHCNLATVMLDATPTVKPVITRRHRRKLQQINNNADSGIQSDMDFDNVQNDMDEGVETLDEEQYKEEGANDDENDELDDSNESEQDVDYDAVAMYVSQNNAPTTTTTTTTTTEATWASRTTRKLTIQSRENLQRSNRQQHSLHCIGEGLSGHITRWSALPAPSCRGKWLRLSLDAPKKCTNSQFIFV